LTLTDQAPSFVFSVPPETSRYQRRTLSATSVLVSPRAASAWARADQQLRVAQAGSEDHVDAVDALEIGLDAPPVQAQRLVVSLARSSIEAVGKPFEVVISRTSGSLASGRQFAACALFWISRRRSFMRLSKLRSSISRKRTSIVATFSRDVRNHEAHVGHALDAVFQRIGDQALDLLGLAPGNAAVMLTQLKLISGSCSRGIVT
jgi:hypothetical protein